jgi:GNAT superfamily N-acetyltransferase
MTQITDPMPGLLSFRNMFAVGGLELQHGELDPTVMLHVDAPTGRPRFAYGRIENNDVTALAVFAVVDPIDGIPCFQLGYAVLPEKRGQGRARDLVNAAIAEMRNGFRRAGVMRFYIEAIAGESNVASNRVAATTISKTFELITDAFSGQPANRYLRLIELS